VSREDRKQKAQQTPGAIAAYKLKDPPPGLIGVGRLPARSDVEAFKSALVDDQVTALSYLRYVKSRDSGSPWISAVAVALSVIAISVSILIAQIGSANLWAEIGFILALVVLLLAFFAIRVMATAERSDERRAWAEAWLLALEPFYVPNGAGPSWFSRKSARRHR